MLIELSVLFFHFFKIHTINSLGIKENPLNHELKPRNANLKK